jgi:hypothetical protein
MPLPKENNGSPIFQDDAIHKLLEAVARSEMIPFQGCAVFHLSFRLIASDKSPSNISKLDRTHYEIMVACNTLPGRTQGGSHDPSPDSHFLEHL